MKPLLFPFPPTRINDTFIEGEFLNSTVPSCHYVDQLIPGLPNEDFRWHAEFYKKVGVDIVTESAFHYPYCFITEKTYRSIASLRPFIIVGPYQTLRFLQSFGFETFSCIIDESYDNIHDPEKRFLSVCKSITTFVNRPLCHIQKDVQSIENKLLHNQHLLSTLFDKELESIKEQIDDSN